MILDIPAGAPALVGRFGPRLERRDGLDGVTFRLWAPNADRVQLHVQLSDDRSVEGGLAAYDTGIEMPRLDADATAAAPDCSVGWFELFVAGVGPETGYRFSIDDGVDIPDPASRFQPHDIAGPSRVVGDHYPWQQTEWRGRPWEEAVILELHVGTFTPAGTWRALMERLPDVVATGITAIEIMPVADFFGRRNWGYDGVLWFAPDSVYGSPDDLRALVDAAHGHGLMVFLDVVYNHFGPEGNYLPAYAPSFFTSSHHTPWGDAIDYRVPEVRAFVIQNALYWLREYRFDGLRLDAVHAITEPGEPHVLQALSAAVGEFARASSRSIHLILENDSNGASLLDPGQLIPHGRYRAQWNDDYHHCWHVLLTGEDAAYYGNYQERPVQHLRRALAEGYVYQGEKLPLSGERRGECSAHLSPLAFVNFVQNHDQIGNRARGDRLVTLTSAKALKAALAVTLLAPMPPLLFMGEEWGARQPFPFFCDFAGELAESVRAGRQREFASLFASLPQGGAIPDPLADSTFASAVLQWEERERSPYKEQLARVRRLLDIRHREIVPLLRGLSGNTAVARGEGSVIDIEWTLGRSRLRLVANLQDEAVAAPPLPPGRVLWSTESRGAAQLSGWSTHWQLETA